MSLPHRPKKYLGQHFLVDPNVAQKIVKASRLDPSDVVIEIGPGQGAITALIAPQVKRLICVETDRDLIETLQEKFKGLSVEIIHADFLKWKLPSLPEKVKIVGNIPYNISTPIIEKLIEDRRALKEAFLTVQLEFGNRLAAAAGSKEYGSLSCFVQFYAQVQVLFKIKSSAFKPPPRVDSCFVHLDFAQGPRYHPKDEQWLFRLIRTAFQQRRKTIVNGLSLLVPKERLAAALRELKISPQARPEQLNLNNFVAISDCLI